MSYLNYDGLAYFKSKLTNWVDQNYLSKTNTGNLTVAGNVTFTNPITGDLDGKAKKDWLGQKIDETYIKSIATNDNAGTIVYTKGNGSTNHILIDLLQGATPIANGRAGLVPAPTVSEMNYFLRGDGNWAVPTDVYVNQNLIASSNNNQFPVLLSGTSGTPATKTNATVGYTNVVSVNPLTNALMASQFISKHPTYNRQSAVSSKVQYSLNFTDVVSGAGHNLGEVVGYVDTVANGGEHELGLRLFGNPNVQGTEEDYVYMGVGLSKTNVAYGHAPSTPLPSAHNEPTDIITRDWLARNGSETGLVHTSMNETIGGVKTFTDETRNTSTAGITTTKLTASGKITGTGTAEISGGSGNTPSLKVTGNETVTGDLSVGGSETVGGTLTTTGSISTTNGNISTTNGTVSGKTGSIGTGGLTVTGPSNLNGGASVTGGSGLSVTGNETVSGTLTVGGKITGNGGAEISGGNGLKVNGNETVTGKLTAEDLEATDDLTVGDTATIGGTILKKTGTNTTQEYVSYITNQEGSRTTIINNMADTYTIKNNNSKLSVDLTTARASDLAKITAALIQTGGGLVVDPTTKKLKVTFEDPDPAFIQGVVEGMIDKDSQGHFTGGLSTNPTTGKLIVDFSQMPDDKFDTLKASLGMQRTVTSSTRTFYVDYDSENANDTVYTKASGFDGERGLSLNRPFKTINGAIAGITTYYSLGSQNVTIYVVPRHIESNPNYPYYRESLSLPTYNRTSGVITIRGYVPEGKSENNSYVVENDEVVASMPKILCNAICGATVNANGRYNLRYLELYNRVRDPANAASNFPGVVNVSEGGYVAFYGVQEHFEFYGHRGALGTLEISSNSAPTTITMNSTASDTNAVQIMSEGEFLGYKYDYNASTHKEAERERPELKTVSTVNIEGTDTNFDNYITVTSCTYDSTNKKIILKYTFERGNTGVASTTFYVKVDNGSFTTVTPVYSELEARAGIYARMNTTVNGKIYLGIAEKLNTKFVFNLGAKHSSSETFTPSTAMASTICVFRIERNGKVENGSSATITVPYTNIYCKGNMTNFLEATSMSSYDNVSGQVHHMHYVVRSGDTVTGRPYALSGGSGIAAPHALIEQDSSTWVSGSAGYAFPGTDGVHGTVEDEEGFNSENPNYSYRKGGSGCWYKEHSSLGL